VTELTKGEYEIQLTVTDDNKNSATDSVVVTVTQSKFPVIFCMDQVVDIILLKKEAKTRGMKESDLSVEDIDEKTSELNHSQKIISGDASGSGRCHWEWCVASHSNYFEGDNMYI